jgi:hypothetical protein
VPAASPPTIDYLYVDANEGGASGGHAAIRFDDQVFHFEHQAPGMVRLRRDDFEGLRYRYTVLDNRTIVQHRVPVTEDTYRRLLDEFGRRRIVQDQHLRTQASLVTDRRLLEALHARREGRAPDEPFALEGVGFFVAEARIPERRLDRPRDAAPALVALRHRVAETYGSDFTVEAMERIRRELAALVPGDHVTMPRHLSIERIAPAGYVFSRRYRDLATSLLALDVLRDARILRADSLIGVDDGGEALDRTDLELIDRLAGALESSLVRLVRSSRPDWGFPLLVGMARLVALDEARRAGRWMFLDAFASDATVIPAEHVGRRPGVIRDLLGEARTDFAALRARLGARAGARGGFSEADFVDLEAAGNRVLEITRALAGPRPMRLARDLGVPSRAAPLVELVVPAMSAADLAQHAARAREREKAHEGELRRLYGYDLLTRNCVTEVFRTIDAALARSLPAVGADAAGSAVRGHESADRIRLESVKRLGGYVDVEHPLTFIPAASAWAVRDAYAVSETIEIPSYRLAGLARLYRQDNPLRVYLRESNTITSTLYQRNPDDSAFLFFTDDSVPVRPILGAINVVTGIGVSTAGLFLVPFDGGDTLRAGLKGVLFSLPELAFFNIRKGSLPYAPRPALSEER